MPKIRIPPNTGIVGAYPLQLTETLKDVQTALDTSEAPSGTLRLPMWMNPSSTLTMSMLNTVHIANCYGYIGDVVHEDKLYVNHNVTTAGVTISWGEIGILVGPIVQANSTLRVIGYGDTTTAWASTGVKKTRVYLDRTQTFSSDDYLWVCFNVSAVTPPVLRAGDVDQVATGLRKHSTAGFRPSQNIGRNILFNVGDNGALATLFIEKA